MGDQSVAVVPGNWVGDAATDVVTYRQDGLNRAVIKGEEPGAD